VDLQDLQSHRCRNFGVGIHHKRLLSFNEVKTEMVYRYMAQYVGLDLIALIVQSSQIGRQLATCSNFTRNFATNKVTVSFLPTYFCQTNILRKLLYAESRRAADVSP
jgi:hypothetical protein